MRNQPHPVALIPSKPYGTEPMRSALGRLADDVLARGIDAEDGPFVAARDLLLRRPPRLQASVAAAQLARPGEPAVQAGRRLGPLLERTVLPIQGPPGTGKTYTGARMILDLVQVGKRIGVTAQSHRVIGNLLEAVVRASIAEGVPLRVAQRSDDPEDMPDERIERIASPEAAIAGLRAGTWDVVGATSWLWAREDAAASVDTLFVDEAGQLSLATVCSVSGAADSLVLLGDPNQLPQVSQGTHPEGASASALEHLVGDARTIAEDRGLLLGTTYRLHPDVNAFISDVFYEARLTTDPRNEQQSVGAGAMLGGTGIRYIALDHEGAGNRSPTEARWIARAIEALVGRPWVDRDGRERRLEVRDVLVVAPYNAQVAEIARTVERELGSRPNVGTVDKFQGREAPVAIYSMTTSTPEDAPRDLDFLYSGEPPQCRAVAGSRSCGPRRVAGVAAGRVSVAGGDPAGQRVLSVRGDRRPSVAAGRWIRRPERRKGAAHRGPPWRRGTRGAAGPVPGADRGRPRLTRPSVRAMARDGRHLSQDPGCKNAGAGHDLVEGHVLVGAMGDATSPGPNITHGVAPSVMNNRMSAPYGSPSRAGRRPVTASTVSASPTGSG